MAGREDKTTKLGNANFGNISRWLDKRGIFFFFLSFFWQQCLIFHQDWKQFEQNVKHTFQEKVKKKNI